MSMGLKKYFYQRSLANNFKNQKTSRKSDRVAILYDENDFSANALIQSFHQYFAEFNNYQLDLIAFSTKKDENKDGFFSFSKKDFNFFSKPKSEKLKALYGQTYRLIFNLFEEESVYLQLMNSCLKANFQIGISDLEQNQMILRVSTKNPDDIFREASKYLKQVNYGS